jgi:hypothetical protein
VPAEPRAEAAGREGRAVVGAERQLAPLDAVRGCRLFDDRDRFVGAAAQLEPPGDDLAGAAVDDRVAVASATIARSTGSLTGRRCGAALGFGVR